MGDGFLRPCQRAAYRLGAGLLASIALFTAQAHLSAERTIEKTEVTTLHAKAVYEFTREVGPGRLKKVKSGSDGSIRRTYIEHVRGSKILDKKLLAVTIVKPVDSLILMGRGGFSPSRGSFNRGGAVRMMSATAYYGKQASGRTCTGREAVYGCIAVDPRVIPLGTLMYVEGYGFGLACDRGSAIKGNRIDLCVDSNHKANRFGRQRVRVHILKPR